MRACLDGLGYSLCYELLLGNNNRGGRSPEEEEKEEKDQPCPKSGEYQKQVRPACLPACLPDHPLLSHSDEFQNQVGAWTNQLVEWLYSLTKEACIKAPLPQTEEGGTYPLSQLLSSLL